MFSKNEEILQGGKEFFAVLESVQHHWSAKVSLTIKRVEKGKRIVFPGKEIIKRRKT